MCLLKNRLNILRCFSGRSVIVFAEERQILTMKRHLLCLSSVLGQTYWWFTASKVAPFHCIATFVFALALWKLTTLTKTKIGVFRGKIFRKKRHCWLLVHTFTVYYSVEVQMWSQSDQSSHCDHSGVHLINISSFLVLQLTRMVLRWLCQHCHWLLGLLPHTGRRFHACVKVWRKW